MRSYRFPWVAMLALAGLTGCAMCDNAHDCSYPAFGGKWQRDNPVSGRVASLFDPAGHQEAGKAVPTWAAPTPAQAEAAQTSESPDSSKENPPAPKPSLEKPADQDAPTTQGNEMQPQAAEKKQAGEEAKPAKEQSTPDAKPKVPAKVGEQPKTEDRKEGGANLLPPLELPPQP